MDAIWNAIDAVPAGKFFAICLLVMLGMLLGGRLFDRRQPPRGAR